MSAAADEISTMLFDAKRSIRQARPLSEQSARLALELASTARRWMLHPDCRIALSAARDAMEAGVMPKRWRMTSLRAYWEAQRISRNMFPRDWSRYVDADAAHTSVSVLEMVGNLMDTKAADHWAAWSAAATIDRVKGIHLWLEKGALPGIPQLENQVCRALQKWNSERMAA